jgi:hypothetical protein
LPGQKVEITVDVPPQRNGENGADAYRRVLVDVRDALSAMIADPGGVRILGVDMSLRDCKIEYDALAVLHERVPAGPIRSGVQFLRGGPIAQGTVARMIKVGMAVPPDRAVNTSITVDHHVAGGETFLEFGQYSEIAQRSDFPA